MAQRTSGTGWTRKESKSGARFVEISRKDAGLPAGMNPWICDDTASIDAVIAILQDVRKDAPARKAAGTATSAGTVAGDAVKALVAAGFTAEQAAIILAGKTGPAKRNGTAKLSVVAVANDDDDDSV